MRARPLPMILASMLAALMAIAASVATGPVHLPVARALFGDSSLEWVKDIVFQVRLPRAVAGFLVGAALSASGAVLQGVFRNPLADPAVLGVSASAALAAQFVVYLGLASASSLAVPVAASIGAALGILALLAMVRRVEGTMEPVLLGGVAIGQLALAAGAVLLALALRDFTVARRLLYWMLGGLDGRTWMHVLWGLGPVLSGIAWILYRARELDAFLLGSTTAIGLGVDVPRVRRELVLVAAALSGVAVAVAGVIGFVGLLVPHWFRRLLGARHRSLVLASALGGGAFVVLADLLARTLIAPEELQLGAVTGVLGAPWFLWILRRRYAELAA